MGGFGSGRHDYASTPTVRECRHLTVNEFTDVVDHPGTTTTVTWGDNDTSEERIRVQLLPADPAEADRATALRLIYTVTNNGTDDTHTRSSVVPLDYTACNFGGSRPWFRCPACDDRRGKLYRPPGGDRFWCRECHALGYESSRTSHDDLKTAIRRYKRAHRQLTGETKAPYDGPRIPERPSGMHCTTYIEHVQDLLDAHEAVDHALTARIEALRAVTEQE